MEIIVTQHQFALLENSNMKKNILLLVLFCVSLGISAQPPQLIPYQAIARDNAGNPVLNQNIGLRFSIHDQTISGAVVWQESQTVVSNNLGIIVTALGGTTQLTPVDWGSGAKFLQVEMDIAGGTNYLDMGTQQMMSVPYALYAETSGSVINNGGGNGSFTHWIGELYGGGIICHLWKDAQGVEHGLIASLNNLGTAPMHNFLQFPTGSTLAVSQIDGSFNTAELLSLNILPQDAVHLCTNYSNQGFDDWYLPACQELIFLYKNIFDLNINLYALPNSDLIGIWNYENNPNDGYTYWSSTITSYTGGMGTAIRVLESTFGYNNNTPLTNYCFEHNVDLTTPNQVRAFRKF